jgi:hypothetical protein
MVFLFFHVLIVGFVSLGKLIQIDFNIILVPYKVLHSTLCQLSFNNCPYVSYVFEDVLHVPILLGYFFRGFLFIPSHFMILSYSEI